MTNKHNYRKKTYVKNANRRHKRKRKSDKRVLTFGFLAAAVIVVCIILILRFAVFSPSEAEYKNQNGIVFSSTVPSQDTASFRDLNEIPHSVDISVQENLLTPNEYSRPRTTLSSVNGIVVHYVANPGSTGMQNRDYFESLKSGEAGTYASSHFVIGLDGEIIQCVPLDEVAYASNERNPDTISIECCHPDETGEFTAETYQSLINLTTWLCEEYSLDADDVIRHYDVTGKECPKYFVENEDAWIEFRLTLAEMLS